MEPDLDELLDVIKTYPQPIPPRVIISVLEGLNGWNERMVRDGIWRLIELGRLIFHADRRISVNVPLL